MSDQHFTAADVLANPDDFEGEWVAVFSWDAKFRGVYGLARHVDVGERVLSVECQDTGATRRFSLDDDDVRVRVQGEFERPRSAA